MKKCKLDDCLSLSDWMGFCGKHAMRVKRYNDPYYITPKEIISQKCRERNLKRGGARPSTYKKLYRRHEHRVIAEQKLGRALRKGEIVHHIDGNKHNNDPNNLEVMTQAEHARIHMLERYAAS